MIIFGITFILLPYLIGSIPFGLILARIFGYGDLRKIGSGNIGATNALRTGNKWLAGLTLLLDGLKGFTILIALSLYELSHDFGDNIADGSQNLYPYVIYTIGLSVILGHIFPVWLKFKGGKGVATAIGTLLAINAYMAAGIIMVWIITFFITRISSLSALTGFFLTAIIALLLTLTDDSLYLTRGYEYMLVVTLLIFATHRSNIARLIKGTEPKFTSKKA